MPRSGRSTPRTGRSADGFSTGSGYVLLGVGAVCFVPAIAVVVAGGDLSDLIVSVLVALLGAGLFALGVLLAVTGRAHERRSAYIAAHGHPRTARVIDAQRTGMEEGDVPIYCLTLEVEADEGDYVATTNRLLQEHEVARLLEHEVRVRVAPDNRQEVVIDDNPVEDAL